MRHVVIAAAVAFQPGWARIGRPVRGIGAVVMRWLDHRRRLIDLAEGHVRPVQ